MAVTITAKPPVEEAQSAQETAPHTSPTEASKEGAPLPPKEAAIKALEEATPTLPVKRKPGRPKGSKGKMPSQAMTPTQKKRVRALRDAHSQDKIEKHLELTKGLTDQELLKRAEEAPEARHGAKPKITEGITEELAERSALAYRLMIRGLTISQIAEQMNVADATAAGYVERVRRTLKLDPQMLDVGYYMGESLAFYQEIRQMAMLHTSGNSPVSTKLNAMRLALEAEERKNSFLQKIGVYSPTVIERIERWMFNSTDERLNDGPVKEAKVNLAAEIGRLLAERSQGHAPVQSIAQSRGDVSDAVPSNGARS